MQQTQEKTINVSAIREHDPGKPRPCTMVDEATRGGGSLGVAVCAVSVLTMRTISPIGHE